MRKTLKKLCEILSKSFFDGVAKDFHLISVHLYIITKKMYGEVPVGGFISTPLPLSFNQMFHVRLPLSQNHYHCNGHFISFDSMH